MEEMWTKKNTQHKWTAITIGDILGSGLAIIKKTNRRNIKKCIAGDTCLWKILIGESAYFIWKLQCERVIGNDNTPFTPAEIKKRWTNMINEWLQLDCRMSHKKYGKKAISKDLVVCTWQNLIHNEDELPDSWTGLTGVLVGIETDMQQRTGRRGR